MASCAAAEALHAQWTMHMQERRHELALLRAKQALEAAQAARASSGTGHDRPAASRGLAKFWDAMAAAVAALDDHETAYCLYAKGLAACGGVPAAGAGAGEAAAVQRLSQGRLEALSAMAQGRGRRAQRAAALYASDAPRPRSAVRVFAVSDLHVDAPGGACMRWVRGLSRTRFQGDALVVAGDVADSLPWVKLALGELKQRFRRVFYVPGNHCLWRRGEEAKQHPDSFAKLMALWQACDELGVETGAAEVAAGLFVVPLLSWYSAAFDQEDPRPGRLRFDRFCDWGPLAEEQVWQVMLQLNTPHLAPPAGAAAAAIAPAAAGHKRGPADVVISASHFLPHPGLPFARGVAELGKAMGCQALCHQAHQVGSDLHVFGHSHVNADLTLGQGASRRRYVQYALEAADVEAGQLMCVWDGQGVCARLVEGGQ